MYQLMNNHTFVICFWVLFMVAIVPELWRPPLLWLWRAGGKLWTRLTHAAVRSGVERAIRDSVDLRIARAMQPGGEQLRRYRVEVFYNAPKVGRVDDYNHFGAFNPDEACRLARAYWEAEVDDGLRIKRCMVVEPGPMHQVT